MAGIFYESRQNKESFSRTWYTSFEIRLKKKKRVELVASEKIFKISGNQKQDLQI
jgi:hypothetical protein